MDTSNGLISETLLTLPEGNNSETPKFRAVASHMIVQQPIPALGGLTLAAPQVEYCICIGKPFPWP